MPGYSGGSSAKVKENFVGKKDFELLLRNDIYVKLNILIVLMILLILLTFMRKK